MVSELTGRFAGEIPELSVHRPTLEETYLRMIDGRSDGRKEGRV